MALHKIRKELVLALAGLLIALTLPGQNLITSYDSITIVKPNRIRSLYKFGNPVLSEMSISSYGPQAIDKRDKRAANSLSSGIITLLTGISTTTSADMLWLVRTKQECNDKRLDWSTHLFCFGELEKSRERVKNEDGSWSIDSKESVYLNWNRNATGIIVENTDTIARFLVVKNVFNDSTIAEVARKIRPRNGPSNQGRKNRFMYAIGNSYPDFALTGTFRGKEFLIVAVASAWQSVIAVDGTPRGLFQSDNDLIAVSRKERVAPYLLLDSDIPSSETPDYLRLALLTRILFFTLSLN